jgi:hypothetical protein
MDFLQAGARCAWIGAALRWSQRDDKAQGFDTELQRLTLGNEASRLRAPRS